MQYDDILAVTTGNPLIKEFIETKMQLDKLKVRERSHLDNLVDTANRHRSMKQELAGLYSAVKRNRDEVDLVRQNNKPLSLVIEGPQPGMQDGDTCHVGGLKGLAAALKNQAQMTRSFSNRTAGHLGGLEVVMHRKSDPEPTIFVRRLDGEKELVLDVRTEVGEMDDLLEDDFDKEAADPYYAAARTLVHYVHRIGRGQALEKQEARLGRMMENYQRYGDLLDAEFPDKALLEKTQVRFDELISAVGDDMNEDKEMDPTEVIALAKYIHQHTDTGLSSNTIRLLEGYGVELPPRKGEELTGAPALA
jgi:hypothetical protein